MKKFALLLCMALFGFGCAANNSGPSLGAQGFNPQLVEQKQKCQDALSKWNIDNGTGTSGKNSDAGIRTHFNAGLNTCLLEYTYDRADGSSMWKVIDIYDGNRALLTYDNQAGVVNNLYEGNNPVKVSANDAFSEFQKRAAVLFEETLQK